MSKYRNTVFYDFKFRFLDVFFQKLPAPLSVGNTVSRLSKYRTENLHFPSTGKYYAPLHLDTSYVEVTSRLHLDQHIYPPLL